MFRRVSLFIVLLAVVTLIAGCLSNNNFSLFPEFDNELSTLLVMKPENKTNNRILLLDIEGVISEWGESRYFYSVEPTTAVIRKKLEKALDDRRIKAVVLRINSPGGTVTASDVVYRELLRYKKEAKVPIVASFQGLAASGGYYVACTADKIVALPTTITGSIGVIMHSFGFNGLFDKIGMESRVIKAGKLKDMGNPFDEMTDDERKVMQQIVDDAYERFLDVVKQGRPNLSEEEIREIADGRIVSAGEAKKLGLVDQLGDLEDAIDTAKQLANIRDAGVILYSTSTRPEQTIFSPTSAELPLNIDMSLISIDEIFDLSRPRFYYMWLGY